MIYQLVFGIKFAYNIEMNVRLKYKCPLLTQDGILLSQLTREYSCFRHWMWKG